MEAHQVVMFVLAHQRSFHPILNRRPILADCTNVDEQACFGVDPACVNDIQFVLRSSDRVMRIYFEQVAATGRQPRQGEMVLGHVVVLGEEVNRSLGDLQVEVRVPG
jgi:hypothetical protein